MTSSTSWGPDSHFVDTWKSNQDLEMYEPQQCAHVSCKYLSTCQYPWFLLFLIFKKYRKMPCFRSVPHTQALRVFYGEFSVDITNGLPGESMTGGWMVGSLCPQAGEVRLSWVSPLIIICSIPWHLLSFHLDRQLWFAGNRKPNSKYLEVNHNVTNDPDSSASLLYVIRVLVSCQGWFLLWSSDGFQDPVRGGAVRPRKEQSPEPHSDWPVPVAGVLPQPDWSNLG